MADPADISDPGSLFDLAEWRAVCDCFVAACLGQDGSLSLAYWDAADVVLARLGRSLARGSDITFNNIVGTIISHLGDDEVRRDTLARVRSLTSSKEMSRWDEVISEGLRIIDTTCPREAFGFRASAILIGEAIEDAVVNPEV